MAIFDRYTSGTEEVRTPLFKPERGANRDEVDRMFGESGAFVFGRRTYEIANGWNGAHARRRFKRDRRDVRAVERPK
jgi:hypothetical protein